MMLQCRQNVTANPTLGEFPLVKETLSLSFIIVLILLYALVFLLAITNNGVVLTVILKYDRMRSIVTNYFLANLAIADITVSVIVLPITLLSNIFSGTSFVFAFFSIIISETNMTFRPLLNCRCICFLVIS